MTDINLVSNSLKDGYLLVGLQTSQVDFHDDQLTVVCRSVCLSGSCSYSPIHAADADATQLSS